MLNWYLEVHKESAPDVSFNFCPAILGYAEILSGDINLFISNNTLGAHGELKP
jgi:hypothetical protein